MSTSARERMARRRSMRLYETTGKTLTTYAAREYPGARRLEKILKAAPGGLFELSEEDDGDELWTLLLALWATTRWRPSGGPASEGLTVVEHLMAKAKHRLNAEQRRYSLRLVEVPYSLWEVVAVEPGRGCEVVDLFSGEERFLVDHGLAEAAAQGYVIFGQVDQIRGFHFFLGSAAWPITSEAAEAIVESFESLGLTDNPPPAGSDLETELWRRYLDAARTQGVIGMPEMRTAGGHRFEFSTARFAFDADQRDAVIAALQTVDLLELIRDEDGEAELTWYRERATNPDAPRSTRGAIRVYEETMEADTRSRPSEQELRKAILAATAAYDGAAVEYLDTEVVDMEAALREHRAGGRSEPQEPAPEISPEEMARVLDPMFLRWADDNVPALGGKTPREAIKTPAGRQKVIEMLIEWEEMVDRSPPGGHRFDFNKLWKELGLER